LGGIAEVRWRQWRCVWGWIGGKWLGGGWIRGKGGKSSRLSQHLRPICFSPCAGVPARPLWTGRSLDTSDGKLARVKQKLILGRPAGKKISSRRTHTGLGGVWGRGSEWSGDALRCFSFFFFAENHINTDLFFPSKKKTQTCSSYFINLDRLEFIPFPPPLQSPLNSQTPPLPPPRPQFQSTPLPNSRTAPRPCRSHTRRLVDHQDQVLFFERRNL
jgi:hypothetical protein